MGPLTRRSFAAKAWGLVNQWAANFQVPPPYNDDAPVFGRTLFMNNYGVRTNPSPSFFAWNWNAPFWLGVNTICVNGKTTTQVGGMFWGADIIEAIAQNMEATLR